MKDDYQYMRRRGRSSTYMCQDALEPRSEAHVCMASLSNVDTAELYQSHNQADVLGAMLSDRFPVHDR